jgi:long-subunit fatty acid transport protein
MNARKTLLAVAALTLVSASAFAAGTPVEQDNRGGNGRAALGTVKVAAADQIGNRDRSGNEVVVKAATRTVSQVAVNVAAPRDGSGS